MPSESIRGLYGFYSLDSEASGGGGTAESRVAAGTEYFIDPVNGNDSTGAGTLISPKRTIQGAIDLARNGVVLGGTLRIFVITNGIATTVNEDIVLPAPFDGTCEIRPYTTAWGGTTDQRWTTLLGPITPTGSTQETGSGRTVYTFAGGTFTSTHARDYTGRTVRVFRNSVEIMRAKVGKMDDTAQTITLNTIGFSPATDQLYIVRENVRFSNFKTVSNLSAQKFNSNLRIFECEFPCAAVLAGQVSFPGCTFISAGAGTDALDARGAGTIVDLTPVSSSGGTVPASEVTVASNWHGGSVAGLPVFSATGVGLQISQGALLNAQQTVIAGLVRITGPSTLSLFKSYIKGAIICSGGSVHFTEDALSGGYSVLSKYSNSYTYFGFFNSGGRIVQGALITDFVLGNQSSTHVDAASMNGTAVFLFRAGGSVAIAGSKGFQVTPTVNASAACNAGVVFLADSQCEVAIDTASTLTGASSLSVKAGSGASMTYAQLVAAGTVVDITTGAVLRAQAS